ncbi:uncharacterized protein BN654_00917 [Clostridium sp. CAG:433]|nr:uncharacterized protein BN654_00917 [Clostridium sp. CAG:433]
MKKKGFTLIELLAVIVILGIITVIAVPKVLDIINKSRESASNSSIKLIKDAIKTQVASSDLTGPVFTKESDGCYLFDFDDQTSGNAKSLEIKNKDKVSGKISYCNGEFQGNIYFNKVIPKPKSFSSDSWNTIVENVKVGNLSKYNVGDTKEVDMGEFGVHTLRIANTSTPDECKTEEFSETACGFVLEFADVITSKIMNSGMTATGGWPNMELRTYINDTIYNSLPDELKSLVIDTKVISNHGKKETENFISIDKMYLLSSAEIWKNGISDDTANSVTRQLDYYSKVGVSTVNSNNGDFLLKKYNNSNSVWLLRTLNSTWDDVFYGVHFCSGCGSYNCNVYKDQYGVSPAFRIGQN